MNSILRAHIRMEEEKLIDKQIRQMQPSAGVKYNNPSGSGASLLSDIHHHLLLIVLELHIELTQNE